MKLGYDLTTEQTQKLVMTTELVQAIKILQFNAQELDTYVNEQLLANPVLEHAEQDDSVKDAELEDHSSQEDTGQQTEALEEYLWERGLDDISYRQGNYQQPEQPQNNYEQFTSAEVTLPEHLMFQLQFACEDEKDRHIGRYIIESLDENGYLTSMPEEMAQLIGVETEEIERVLAVINTFEPAGLGAKNLCHCLLIQLGLLDMKTPAMEKMLLEHMDDLAANRLQVIAKSLHIKVKRVQEMVDVVKALNPRPGRMFARDREESGYIVPDIHVEKIDGSFVVSLNERTVPHLQVSAYYRRVLAQSKDDQKVSEYLTERVNAAVWLIRSIQQRKDTILNVARTIVEFQEGFFEKGSKYLKTLSLHHVAEKLGIHESTVSRSVNGKYLQCQQGMYELKHFFSAGVQNGSGEGVSSVSIKTMIKELIDQENPASPYSDQKLVTILQDKGIGLSRRTVAKYRDEMGILSSSKRKRF